MVEVPPLCDFILVVVVVLHHVLLHEAGANDRQSLEGS